MLALYCIDTQGDTYLHNASWRYNRYHKDSNKCDKYYNVILALFYTLGLNASIKNNVTGNYTIDQMR